MRAKRIFCLLMVVLMVASLLPVSAMAAELQEAALDTVGVVSAVEELAPVEEELAPVEEELAPVEEEAAPVEEEAAPVEEETTPVVEVVSEPVADGETAEEAAVDAEIIAEENPVFVISGEGAQELTALNVYNTAVASPKAESGVTVTYKAREAGEVVKFADIVAQDGTVYTVETTLSEKWLSVEDEIDEVDFDTAYATLVDTVIKTHNIPYVGDDLAKAEVAAFLALVSASELNCEPFGPVGSEESSVETIKVINGLKSAQIEITVKDSRIATALTCSNASLTYGAYTEADLIAAVAPVLAASGTEVAGDIALVSEGVEELNAGTYTVEFAYAGDDVYKPCKGSAEVTIKPAPACISYEFANGNVVQYTEESYGISLVKNPAGLSVIELLIGVDISGDSVSTAIQMIMPEDIYNALNMGCMMLGKDITDGFALSEVTDILEDISALQSSMVEMKAVTEILSAIDYIREQLTIGDITVYPVTEYHPNIGVYVLYAVSADKNHETAYAMDYLVVYPDGEQVELTWNETDCNGILLHSHYDNFDLRATASVAAAQPEVAYLMVGAERDAEGYLFLTQELEDVKDIESGAFLQIAYMGSWGNDMYCARPLVRTITVVADLVMDIGDQTVKYTGEVCKPEITWNCGCDADYVTVIKGELGGRCYVNIDLSNSPCLNELSDCLPFAELNIADFCEDLKAAAAECCIEIPQEYIDALVEKIEATGFDVILINSEYFPTALGTYDVYALAYAPLHLCGDDFGTLTIAEEVAPDLGLTASDLTAIPGQSLTMPVVVSGVDAEVGFTGYLLDIAANENLEILSVTEINTAPEFVESIATWDGENVAAKAEEGELELFALEIAVADGAAEDTYEVTLNSASNVTGYTLVDDVVGTVEVVDIAPVLKNNAAKTYSYNVGQTAEALSVDATSPDGTTDGLTYQWYANGEPIEGATEATYTPSTAAAGTTTYYCVVTNTVEGFDPISTTSEAITVEVKKFSIRLDADEVIEVKAGEEIVIPVYIEDNYAGVTSYALINTSGLGAGIVEGESLTQPSYSSLFNTFSWSGDAVAENGLLYTMKVTVPVSAAVGAEYAVTLSSIVNLTGATCNTITLKVTETAGTTVTVGDAEVETAGTTVTVPVSIATNPEKFNRFSFTFDLPEGMSIDSIAATDGWTIKDPVVDEHGHVTVTGDYFLFDWLNSKFYFEGDVIFEMIVAVAEDVKDGVYDVAIVAAESGIYEYEIVAGGADNAFDCTYVPGTITVGEVECEHEYEGYETTAPSCTEPGEMTYTCTKCGDWYTEEIAALGHTVVTDEAVAPTCTETGLTEGSHCSVCSEVLVAQEEVAALGHSWGEWVETKAATCTEDGSQRRDCENCDHYETEEIAALGHSHGTAWEKDEEFHWHECHCGDVADKAGHTWDEGEVTTEPTVDAEGVKTFTCTVCGATKTEAVERLEPDPVYGILGDVNGDGYADPDDASLILQYDVGYDVELDLTVGDCNADGFVDPDDASLILQYDVGYEVYGVGCNIEITSINEEGVGSWKLVEG